MHTCVVKIDLLSWHVCVHVSMSFNSDRNHIRGLPIQLYTIIIIIIITTIYSIYLYIRPCNTVLVGNTSILHKNVFHTDTYTADDLHTIVYEREKCIHLFQYPQYCCMFCVVIFKSFQQCAAAISRYICLYLFVFPSISQLAVSFLYY